MTLAPYIIVTATSLDHLVIEVQKKMELGYVPQGQPFNAGAYTLPQVGISQAMVVRPLEPGEIAPGTDLKPTSVRLPMPEVKSPKSKR